MAQSKILVVDDEPNFLRFVTELLIGAGYDLRGTSDPLGAAILAEEFHPDLMICDVMMPGIDGLRLACDLRSKDATKAIPIMFLTARKASEALEAATATGAVAYLEKPVQSSKLLWMIKSLLENSRSDKSTE